VQWSLAVATVLLVAGFYLVGYRPQDRRQKELTAMLAERQRDLKASKTQTRILPQVATEVDRLRARLERSKKSIPKQQDLAPFIREVTQLGQQASLRKPLIEPKPAVRGPRVSELPISLTFDGDFVNVYSFLRNVEEMPRLTRIRQMKITGKDKTGQVRGQVLLNIYFQPEE
jgi:Tfp pilus assembly protein PilO